MTKTLVVLQSRTASTRLPCKALLPIKGIPSSILAAKRVILHGHDVVVATTSDESDDFLVNQFTENKIKVMRGPVDDVLKRFVIATQQLSLDDVIVRLTADNVFPDGEFVEEFVQNFLKRKLTYCTTNTEKNGFPYGLGAEAFTVSALREADNSALDQYDREHVTPWIRRNKPCETYTFSKIFDMSHLRCTLDTFDDYINLLRVFSEIVNPMEADWKALCEILKHQNSRKVKVQRESQISEFSLGTVQLGTEYGVTNTIGIPCEEEVSNIVNTSLKYGVNTFDTARGYGLAEYRLGRRLKNYTNTKIITKLIPSIDLDDSNSGIEAQVKASVFESCQKLQREKLDMVLLHRFQHYLAPSVWNTVIALKNDGVIGNVGISINNPEELLQVITNYEVGCIQLPFNILDWRWQEKNILQKLNERADVLIFARSIFLQGLLSSSLDLWPSKFKEMGKLVLARLEQLANELGRASVSDLCIAFVRSQPWVHSLVIGCLTSLQVEQNANLFLNRKLSSDECTYVKNKVPVLPQNFLNPVLW